MIRGHDSRARAEPIADGGFHFGQTDRADFALGLREDEVRLECANQFRVDPIERERALQKRFDLAINLRAARVDIELGFRARRQTADGRRKIAFVRAANQKLRQAEGADNFGAARQERDKAQLIHNENIRDRTGRCSSRGQTFLFPCGPRRAGLKNSAAQCCIKLLDFSLSSIGWRRGWGEERCVFIGSPLLDPLPTRSSRGEDGELDAAPQLGASRQFVG